MVKEYRAPYNAFKANRDEKVARWKAIGKFKKAQKREEREESAAPGSTPAGLRLPSELPEQLRRPLKKPKPSGDAPQSAEAAAWNSRQRLEAKQAEERAEAQREAAERQRQQKEVKRRRAEQTAKLNKRTKRGQPILSNQIERMLGKIQAP
tara:strand:+ start:372 stop:824 length:453 start_codon:yes stop_codon:yes gene_type:complete